MRRAMPFTERKRKVSMSGVVEVLYSAERASAHTPTDNVWGNNEVQK